MTEGHEPADNIIKVYVRKGATDDERRLSFHWADRIDPLVLLERGYALDGNQAVESVIGTAETAMPILLRNAELRLIAFLRESGYVVKFA